MHLSNDRRASRPGRQPTIAPMADDDPSLTAAVRGARALLLDLDGVILLAGAPIPGSPEAIATLERCAIPYRIVTNTSAISRTAMARWAAKIGAPVPAERFQSALSASAAWTRRTFPGSPLYVLASDDAKTEFDGQRLLSHEEAGRSDATAAAVIIGDSPEEASFDNLNRAFRLVKRGARLVGMHRNPWWLTQDGPTLDSGAYVAGLEFAAETRATILGKPSSTFFSMAVADLRRTVGRDLRRDEIVMIGDDVRTDIRAAQRAGLRAVFVESGKHGPADVEAASRERGGRRPDAVAPNLAAVVAAFVSD